MKDGKPKTRRDAAIDHVVARRYRGQVLSAAEWAEVRRVLGEVYDLYFDPVQVELVMNDPGPDARETKEVLVEIHNWLARYK